jgi:uncharacterized Zn-binding protein involved in type VI secretion
MPSILTYLSFCDGHKNTMLPRPGQPITRRVFVGKKPIHCTGDKWLPHGCPAEQGGVETYILPKSRTVFCGGKSVAASGDFLSCGAVVKTTNTVFVGGAP